MFELSSAFPQLNQYYGLMSGLAYTVPYSIFGLFSGYLTTSKKRALLLCLMISLTSCIHMCSGITSSFGVLCLMRVLHGAMSSATDPLAYSLVADYYPADKRGTPNAILSSGNFIGIALSCMSILFIKNWGWRATYMIMGGIGITMAVIGSLVFSAFKKREDELPPLEEVDQKIQKKGFGNFIEKLKSIN